MSAPTEAASFTINCNVPVSVVREYFDGLAKVEKAKQGSGLDFSLLTPFFSLAAPYLFDRLLGNRSEQKEKKVETASKVEETKKEQQFTPSNEPFRAFDEPIILGCSGTSEKESKEKESKEPEKKDEKENKDEKKESPEVKINLDQVFKRVDNNNTFNNLAEMFNLANKFVESLNSSRADRADKKEELDDSTEGESSGGCEESEDCCPFDSPKASPKMSPKRSPILGRSPKASPKRVRSPKSSPKAPQRRIKVKPQYDESEPVKNDLTGLSQASGFSDFADIFKIMSPMFNQQNKSDEK